jgi:hypothetical protein
MRGFMTVLFITYRMGHEINKNIMGGACGTYGGEESCVRGFGGFT